MSDSITKRDIQEAVARRIIDEKQGIGFINLIRKRNGFLHSIKEKDEPFEMFRGFAEIQIALGLVIFLLGIGLLPSSGENIFFIPVLVIFLSWLFSHYFTLKRRMKLPSMMLASVFAVSLIDLMMVISGEVLDKSNLFSSVNFLALGLIGVLGMGLYFYKFRLPFAIFILGLFGFVIMMSTAYMIDGKNVLEFSFSILFDLRESAVFAFGSLFFGLLAFSFGIYFDIKDPYRVSRFSQTGFWMHVLAAPLIVNTFLSTAYNIGGTLGYLLSFLLFGIISFISLVIDRRSFLTAGLGYLTMIVWSAIKYLTPDLNFVMTMIVLGVVVTALGSWWGHLRTWIMLLLPEFPLKGRLPPCGYQFNQACS